MSNKAGLLCLRQCCVSSPWPEGFFQPMVFDRIATVQAVVSWQASLLFSHGSSGASQTDLAFCDGHILRWYSRQRALNGQTQDQNVSVCLFQRDGWEGGREEACTPTCSLFLWEKVQFTHALQMSEFNSTNTGQTAQWYVNGKMEKIIHNFFKFHNQLFPQKKNIYIYFWL